MISPLFLSGCRESVRIMRAAGINESLIACVITDIRSAALTEERLRMDNLIRENPPTYYDFGTVRKELDT